MDRQQEAELLARVAQLEAEMAEIKEFFRRIGRRQRAQKESTAQPGDAGQEEPTGQLVTTGNLDVLAGEGEDPEDIARSIQRARDRDAGRLPFEPGSAAG